MHDGSWNVEYSPFNEHWGTAAQPGQPFFPSHVKKNSRVNIPVTANAPERIISVYVYYKTDGREERQEEKTGERS